MGKSGFICGSSARGGYPSFVTETLAYYYAAMHRGRIGEYSVEESE